MADVEQRAEAEAAHKGLSGGAARAYVGGVFNRIRQAHGKATQPGKGARHLQRRARQEARQEAKNRVSRHEQLAALEKQRLRSRTHREEPRKTQPAPTPAQPAATGKAEADYERFRALPRHLYPGDAHSDEQMLRFAATGLSSLEAGQRRRILRNIEAAEKKAHNG